MRLFVAIELPERVKEALAREASALSRKAPHARWVKPEGMHLTLAFLGEQPEENLAAIKQALVRVCARHSKLELEIKGGGGFGSSKHPRVMWVGVEGQLEKLSRLQEELSAELEPLGYVPEKRAFRPHLTLARAKELKGDEKLAWCAAQLGEFDAGKLSVSGVELFQSHLSPKGARYTSLCQAPLGP